MRTPNNFMHTKPASIKLLGDPALRCVSQSVDDFSDPETRREAETLLCTLAYFREGHGFGRAISAPQIGFQKRLIALDLGESRPRLIFNPQITRRSLDRFTMWDDCMSFPQLLVRLARHHSISLDYQDAQGHWHSWNDLKQNEAELLQHEIDHLDGVLAIDRALDQESVVLREVYESNRDYYGAIVDYVIGD